VRGAGQADGPQSVYVYRARKTRVDELPPPNDPDAHKGFDFGCFLSFEGVDEAARELLKVCVYVWCIKIPVR